MSGIALYISKSNHNLDEKRKFIISDSLRFKGPDTKRFIENGNSVFFQNMFFATEEDLNEELPKKIGNLIICSDSRIDNRPSLLKKLNLDNHLICDSEIIIKSYKKWGEDCVNHLIGAFAFIIYDQKRDSYFIARDQLGLKPLYLIEDKDSILISSSIKTFLDVKNYKLEINLNRIRNYLSFTSNKNNETFYKEIKKIPKASITLIKNNIVSNKKYYQLKKIKVDKNTSDAEYIKKFREIFFEVIRSHSRSPNKIVSSALSGGLDSTSISKTINHLNKNGIYDHHTFSCIFKGLTDIDFKKTDELNFMKDSINQVDNSHFIYIDNDKNGPVSKLNYFQEFHCTPVAAINGYIHFEMFKSAKSYNSRIFLDGFDGDTVISHGYEKLFDYAREFKFNRLFRERRELDNRFNVRFSYLKTIKTYILKPLVPSFLDYLYRFIFRKNILPISDIKLLKFNNPKALYSFKYIKDFFGYYPHKYIGDAQEYHIRNLENSIWEFSFEIIENLSLKNNIEVRYPFFDLRVVEFCSSLPKHLKNKDGLNRYILRESLKDILPESVYARVTKANLSPVSRNNINKIDIKKFKQKINDSKILRECLDESFFELDFEDQIKNNKIEAYKIYQLLAILSWENQKNY